MSTRIILADDHPLIREGLKKILEQEMKLDVVAQASDGRTAIELVRQHRPDILIIDIGMPGLNGIETTRIIKQEFSEIKVIALSMHTERNIVADMLQAGASAYLLKDSAPDELEHAINLILKNKKYLSADVAGFVVDEFVQHREATKSKLPGELTHKEKEVLQLLAEGKSIKDIAGILFVSTTTIETHKQHIMEKLNLHSIAELTKFAVREGITDL
jgi:DNA-binding NarL/FixJ family response regulator